MLASWSSSTYSRYWSKEDIVIATWPIIVSFDCGWLIDKGDASGSMFYKSCPELSLGH